MKRLLSNLSSYLAERLLVVSECHEKRLEDVFVSGRGQRCERARCTESFKITDVMCSLRSLDFLKRIAFQSLLALSYLHNEGIVHRNISPTNILITKEVSLV